jgi:hypothetical protein
MQTKPHEVEVTSPPEQKMEFESKSFVLSSFIVRKRTTRYYSDWRRFRRWTRNHDVSSVLLPKRLRCGIRPWKPEITDVVKPPPDLKLKYHRPAATRNLMDEQIQSFLSASRSVPDDMYTIAAREIVSRSLDKYKTSVRSDPINPYSASFSITRLPRSTSPGFPYIKIGVNTKAKASRYVYRDLKIFTRACQSGLPYEMPPCIAGARQAHCKIEKNKVRLVWAYPFVVTVVESMFMLPLMDVFKNCGYFGWTTDYINGKGVDLYHTLYANRGRPAYMFDYSHFDQTPDPKTIFWSFRVLRKFLKLNKTQKEMWKRMVSYFVHTPILFYDRFILKHKGVPSGSCFTQIIDSIINLYWMTASFLSNNDSNTLYEYQYLDSVFLFIRVLGDDSLIQTSTFVEPDTIIGYSERQFGATISRDKMLYFKSCFTFDDFEERIVEAPHSLVRGRPYIEFLGKIVMNALNIGVFNPDLVAAQIWLPEVPDKSPSDFLTRLIGVAWSTGTAWIDWHVLTTAFTCLRQQFGNVTPAPFSKQFEGMFRNFLGLKPQSALLLSFPSSDLIVKRYTKAPNIEDSLKYFSPIFSEDFAITEEKYFNLIGQTSFVESNEKKEVFDEKGKEADPRLFFENYEDLSDTRSYVDDIGSVCVPPPHTLPIPKMNRS